MSLRTRLTLACGGAVFVALTSASLVIYFSVRSKLHDQIDVSLIQTAQNVATKTGRGGATPPGKLPAGTFSRGTNPSFPASPYLGSDASGYFQIIPSLAEATREAPASSLAPSQRTSTSPKGAAGKVPPGQTLSIPNRFVPLLIRDRAVASGASPPYFRDVRYRGVAMRLYTMRLASSRDGLVRSARPLTEANATIGRVRLLLLALTIGGAALAALIGRLAAATVLRPIRGLAAAVDDVRVTRDLNRRIAAVGTDEVASLARNFNAMLAALKESQRVQQQLIADASHELRTPLTAHRANIELLARPDLPPHRRPQVLHAAVRGIEELSTMLSDLIAAARNGKSLDTRDAVALDGLVADAVARARRRAPGLRFDAHLDPYDVPGATSRLERAIDNVLDNAIKWSSSGGTIEVALVDGLVTVRDHGPGIEQEDLPHVFDRFYRSPSARGLPGSGLGLAIVKQTVDDHGGSVSVANAEGGGAIVALRFDAANP
jgi:two-component system sensor histidine kinase MprB